MTAHCDRNSSDGPPNYFCFFYKNYIKGVCIGFACVAAFLIIYFSFSKQEFEFDYNTFSFWISTLATVAAIFYSWIATFDKWKESFPKKMTVYFKTCDGHDKFEPKTVSVGFESDIRPYAQQIGRQLNGGKNLDLDSKYTAKKDYNTKERVTNYTVVMHLKDKLEQEPSPPATHMTIDLSSLYKGETAKLADLPRYEQEAIRMAGDGNNITLTGSGPIWLYLRIAHALHGKARSLTYTSPVTDKVTIFDHSPE